MSEQEEIAEIERKIAELTEKLTAKKAKAGLHEAIYAGKGKAITEMAEAAMLVENNDLTTFRKIEYVK